uniref:Coiled-coil domain-containing protein 149 n=1 Tax=Lygus hesperus TaxID=30085 RepID=A0A146LCW5_LYGHE
MDDNVAAEFAAIKRKLQSKSEALSILNRELTTCKRERDHFKQLLESKEASSPSLNKKNVHEKEPFNFSELSLSSLDKRGFLNEIDELKRKLRAAQNEIKGLRGECGRERGVKWHQREELIEEIEEMREKIRAMSADLQSVLDEKEELIMERDAYRFKVYRLNHEIQTLLKSDSGIDVDSLVMENTYLKERFEQAVAEKEMLQQGLTKYKSMLDKNRIKGNVRLGTNTTCGGMVVTHRQVQELLENDNSVWKSPYNAEATLADLRSLSLALLEALQDKSLALIHQRKANKILAQRVTTLEGRLSEEASVFPSQVLVQGLSNVDVNKEMDKSVVEEYKEYMAKSRIQEVNEPTVRTKEEACSVQKEASEEEVLPPELQELVLRAMEEISENAGTESR